ncbi:MAG: T9SS type A sorting domain-containing protein [Sphingomonadales bacterium]
MRITAIINLKILLIAAVFSLSAFAASAQTQKGADIDGEAADDQSGFSVSMPDANTVAIGAYANDGKASDAGHVRIYVWSGSTWTQKGADIDGEAMGDQSGFSVSMPDANTVAIGAFGNDGKASNAGHVRIYSWSGSAWTQKGADIDGEAAGDNSGISVSMPDANTVAIGAPGNDGTATDAGHVRIYVWSGSAWTQKGADTDGEAGSDRSGYSLSMPDANTVAIGAFGNDGKASNAGHVRIYSWSGSAWTQKGADIDGEASYDASGCSVSMPDANTVAIGAQYNDGNASDAGHVRVYSLGNAGILENTFGNALKSFPNPTHGETSIELGANYNDVSVIVRNTTGQEVMRKSYSSANSFKLNIPGEAGIYLMEVTAQDKKAMLKVVKK